MKLADYEFGFIDLEKLLEQGKGKLDCELSDLGTYLKVEGDYEWQINNDQIILKPKNEQISLTLPKIIPIKSNFLAFIGLYDGDGNKTRGSLRPIGFSQREMNIHKFVNDMLHELFGNHFSTKWSLLESSQRFQTPQMTLELENLRQSSQIFNNLSTDDLMKEFIKQEFLQTANNVGLKVDPSEISTPVVSAKKGARSAGKSSLEYIQNLTKSEKFLPFWLKIVRTITDNVIFNIQKSDNDSFIFHAPPHESQNFFLDVKKFAGDVKWKKAKGQGTYDITDVDQDFISIARSQIKANIINKKFALSPFHFLVAGIYLAEGDTKKDNLFLIETEKVMLNVALTSSEDSYIKGFIGMLENLGKDMLVSWKVKVGTKYETETEEIAQKYGVVTLRAGEKGQGYIRTPELDSEAKQWALNHNEELKKYPDFYHHLEMTGAGITRPHIISHPTLAPYFLCLIRDMVFNTDNLENYLIQK